LAVLARVPDALDLGAHLLWRESRIDHPVDVVEGVVRVWGSRIPGPRHDRQAGVEPVLLRPVAAAVRAARGLARAGAGERERRRAGTRDRVVGQALGFGAVAVELEAEAVGHLPGRVES